MFPRRTGPGLPYRGKDPGRADRRRPRGLRRVACRGTHRWCGREVAQLGPRVQPAPGLLRAEDLPTSATDGRAGQGHPRTTTPGHRRATEDPRVVLRYLKTVAATLRPNTVELRTDSLITFAEYLAAHHPGVRSLPQLTREHMEGFLTYNHGRPWRGRVARDQPVSRCVSKRTVIDLRCFFDDLALWGWAQRPNGRLLLPTDIPRLDRPLPRRWPRTPTAT